MKRCYLLENHQTGSKNLNLLAFTAAVLQCLVLLTVDQFSPDSDTVLTLVLSAAELKTNFASTGDGIEIFQWRPI